MQRRTLILTLAVLCSLTVVLNMAAAGGSKKSDSKVKAKIVSSKLSSTGQQTVTIELKVDKGWYIYANPVGNKLLAPNATTVKVKGNVKGVKVAFPIPKVKKDDVIGDYNYYQGKILLNVSMQNPSKQATDFVIQVNACDSVRGICLQPGQLKLSTK